MNEVFYITTLSNARPLLLQLSHLPQLQDLLGLGLDLLHTSSALSQSALIS